MVTRRSIALLLVAAVGLPIVICTLIGIGRLLGALEDAGGAVAVERVALTCGVLWIVDLVLLVVLLGINALGESDGPPE